MTAYATHTKVNQKTGKLELSLLGTANRMTAELTLEEARQLANKMLAQINLAEYDQEHQSEYDNEQLELDQVQQEYD
jgi:hypothetical protein